MRISELTKEWDEEDRSNLWHILTRKSEKRAASSQELEQGFYDLYNNSVRTAGKAVGKTALNKVGKMLGGRDQDTSLSAVQTKPSYSELVKQACDHNRIKEDKPSLEELELFLSQDVILTVLKSMPPRKRSDLLQTEVDAAQFATKGGVRPTGMAGPMTILGTIGVGQASGFGIYLAATTALGFLTSALGITLPFVVYTGLTTALSVFLGPIGIAAGLLWATYKLTGPDWKWLIPALLYVASVRHRPAETNP